jgi:hypothetical protein
LWERRRDFDFDLGPDINEAIDIGKVEGGKLRPKVSFQAAPIPGPAASYSPRLVRYQVSRTMCSGPAPASPRSLMIRFRAEPTWAAISLGYSPFSSPPVWPASTIHRPGALNSTPCEKPRGFDHSAGCRMRILVSSGILCASP